MRILCLEIYHRKAAISGHRFVNYSPIWKQLNLYQNGTRPKTKTHNMGNATWALEMQWRSSRCGTVGHNPDCSGSGHCGGVGLRPDPVQRVQGSGSAAAPQLWLGFNPCSTCRECGHGGKKKVKILFSFLNLFQSSSQESKGSGISFAKQHACAEEGHL